MILKHISRFFISPVIHSLILTPFIAFSDNHDSYSNEDLSSQLKQDIENTEVLDKQMIDETTESSKAPEDIPPLPSELPYQVGGEVNDSSETANSIQPTSEQATEPESAPTPEQAIEPESAPTPEQATAPEQSVSEPKALVEPASIQAPLDEVIQQSKQEGPGTLIIQPEPYSKDVHSQGGCYYYHYNPDAYEDGADWEFIIPDEITGKKIVSVWGGEVKDIDNKRFIIGTDLLEEGLVENFGFCFSG